MVGHQAKAMDTVSETFHSLLEEQIEACAIPVIKENRLAIIATEDNVIQCSRVDNSWFSSHETKLSQNSQYCKPDPIFFYYLEIYHHCFFYQDIHYDSCSMAAGTETNYRLLNYSCIKHLGGMEGTADEGVGGHGLKAHFPPYLFIGFKLLWGDISDHRQPVRPGLEILTDG